MIALVIFLLSGYFAFAVSGTYNRISNALNKSTTDRGGKELRSSNKTINQKKPFSVLLLGTDTGDLGRNSKTFNGARTDTIILVTVNPETKKVTLNSIPRDSSVLIPGHEKEGIKKVNAAYEIGQQKATINTIQDWFGIPIDFYAVVNMGGLSKLVDEIGGIEVTSPLDFDFSQKTARAQGQDMYRFKKGSHEFQYSKKGDFSDTVTKKRMTGKDALAFTRMRYQDPRGDYGRQERQRLVIEAIAKQAMKDPTKTLAPGFVDELSKNYRSNMSLGDATTVLKNYNSALNHVSQTKTPLEGETGLYDSSELEYISKDKKDAFANSVAEQLGINSKDAKDFAGNGEIVRDSNQNLTVTDIIPQDNESKNQDVGGFQIVN